MTYDEFLKAIKNRVQERLGRLYQVGIEKELNQEGVPKDTLYMNRREETAKPTVYLNAYYDLYQNKMTLDDIMDEIMEVYEWNEAHIDIFSGNMKAYDDIKGSIILRLVNVEKNKWLLDTVPHVHYLDLAIVFCIYENIPNNIMTVLIRNEHMEQWKVSVEELYSQAKMNNIRLLAPEIKTMNEIMKEIAQERMGVGYSEELIEDVLEDGNNYPMYVLSNCNRVFGATSILFTDVLKDFSERINSDLIVLPASIQEVLLLPEDCYMGIGELKAMLEAVSGAQQEQEEFLSNEVYYFSRTIGRLFFAEDGKTGKHGESSNHFQ